VQEWGKIANLCVVVENKYMSENRKDELVALANRHFADQALPLLKKALSDDLSSVVVYIAGSVANGFCDEQSDIDVEIFFTNKVSEEPLKLLNDTVIGDKMVDGVRLSYWITPHSKRLRQLQGDDLDEFWEDFNPYFLHDLQNFIPLFDENNMLKQVQTKVKFYPDEIFTRVVRGLWITINDSGVYSSKQAHKRGNLLGQNIYYYRGVEALLRLVYVLNRKYYPATKWLPRKLDGLEKDFTVRDLLNISNSNFDEQYERMMDVVQNIKDYLLTENEVIEKDCIENYGLNFSKPYFIFRAF